MRIHMTWPLPTSNDIPYHIPNLLYLTLENRFAWVKFELGRSPAHDLIIAMS